MAKKYPPVPGGKAALNRKAAIVRKEHPEKTPSQVYGEAAGILRGRAKKKRRAASKKHKK